jgi:hypothetical protein
MARQKDDRETCFVIGPIGAPESPVRKMADQVMKYIIEPEGLSAHTSAHGLWLREWPRLVSR